MHDYSVPSANRRTVSVAAVITIANLVALAVATVAVLQRYAALDPRTEWVSHSEDAVLPLIVIVLCQAAVNGIALLLFAPSRRAGAGILIGTLAAAIGAAVWFDMFLISQFA